MSDVTITDVTVTRMHEGQTLKECFFRDMKEHAYKGQVGVQPFQLRDLIRTYVMGWVGGLVSMNNKEKVAELMPLLHEIAHEDWMPRKEWRWW